LDLVLVEAFVISLQWHDSQFYIGIA